MNLSAILFNQMIKKIRKLSLFSQNWLLICWLLSLSTATFAQDTGPKILSRKHYRPELTTAQNIFIQARAYDGPVQVDATPILDIMTRRMENFGYTVFTDFPYQRDAEVQIVCTEPKNPFRQIESVESSNNDTVPPPCALHYFFKGQKEEWQRIDRIVFNEGVHATQRAQVHTHGHSLLAFSIRYLEEYDFPLLLTAEWFQVARLSTHLDDPNTPLPRKLKIIDMLGEILGEAAYPCLIDALQQDELKKRATYSLGFFGKKAQPHLVSLLKDDQDIEVQATAAQSLGRIGGMTGDTSLTPLMLDRLTTPGVDMRVQTEIVWALGKAPDFRAFPVLEELYHRVWNIQSNDPELQRLREAVDWSIREVRQGGHTDDYE